MAAFLNIDALQLALNTRLYDESVPAPTRYACMTGRLLAIISMLPDTPENQRWAAEMLSLDAVTSKLG